MKIEKLASDGKGIARTDGGIVFVSGALPGEEVEAEIILRKREYSVANVTKIVTPNERRAVPPCPHFFSCGGCSLQHADYSLQLEMKAAFVEEALKRIGKFQDSEIPQPIICTPSPQIWNYRNKASFPVRNLAGIPTLGFFAAGSHKLVKIDDCKIINEKLNSALQKIETQNFGIPAYNEIKHSGILRHVLLRTDGENWGKVLVSFILNGKLDKESHKKILHFAKNFENSTFTLNENTQKGNIIIGNKTEIITGDGQLEARVGVYEKNKKYKIRYDTTSFFQVNTAAAENIYSFACSLVSGENLLELYSGVGTLTLQLADVAKNVVAIEEWAPAVELAKKNFILNGVDNIRAVCAKSEDFDHHQKFDSVVLDPPRGGCDEKVISKIAAQKIPNVVYISCNPATLARDLKRFCELGYKLDIIRAFDMFPQTTHVECVARIYI